MFRFENYDELPTQSYVDNNGHTVKVSFKFKDDDMVPKVKREQSVLGSALECLYLF